LWPLLEVTKSSQMVTMALSSSNFLHRIKYCFTKKQLLHINLEYISCLKKLTEMVPLIKIQMQKISQKTWQVDLTKRNYSIETKFQHKCSRKYKNILPYLNAGSQVEISDNSPWISFLNETKYETLRNSTSSLSRGVKRSKISHSLVNSYASNKLIST
jgi:hypothetical protein